MIFETSQFGILSILQIGGDVESISRTVTCTGELSALTCVIPRGEGFHTPPSRYSYLVNVHGTSVVPGVQVNQLLSLYLVSVRYLVPHVLDAHNE